MIKVTTNAFVTRMQGQKLNSVLYTSLLLFLAANDIPKLIIQKVKKVGKTCAGSKHTNIGPNTEGGYNFIQAAPCLWLVTLIAGWLP